MRAIILLIVLLVQLSLSTSSFAWSPADPNFYSYYPRSILSLGIGFSPNDVSQAKIRCINYEVAAAETGALNTEFRSYVVADSESFKKAIQLDAKIDASILSFHGGASIGLTEDQLFSQDSITVVLVAGTEFGRITMKSVSLTDSASALLKDGAQFEKTCGSRFTAIERRGATVWAIVNIRNISQESLSRIKAGASGGGGIGAFSANLSASLDQEIKSASNSGRLSIQVEATGGAGFIGLGDLVSSMGTSSSSLTQIQSALGTYIKTFTSQTSAPIGFHVESFESLGWNPQNADIWGEIQETKLRMLVAEFRKTERWVDSALGIQNGSDIRWTSLNDAQKAAIFQAIPAAQAYQASIALTHFNCKSASSRDLSACNVPTLQSGSFFDLIPTLPTEPSGAYIAYVDGNRIDAAVAALLPWGAGGDFKSSLGSLYPGYKNAKFKILAAGYGLTAGRVVLLPTSGCGGNNIIEVEGLSGNTAELIIFDDTNSNSSIMSKINGRILSNPNSGHCSGTFAWEVVDQLGRKSQIKFLDAEWDLTNNASSGIQNSISLKLLPL